MCRFQAAVPTLSLRRRGGLGKAGSVQETLGPAEVNGLAQGPGYCQSDPGLIRGGSGLPLPTRPRSCAAVMAAGLRVTAARVAHGWVLRAPS